MAVLRGRLVFLIGVVAAEAVIYNENAK